MSLQYFQYGSYAHPQGEVRVNSFSEDAVYNDRHIATSVKKTMSLSGMIVASGDVAIDARVAQIQAAYALDGFDACLYLTSGAQSHLRLSNSGSLYGVQVMSGPTFTIDPNAAHFTTGIPFAITLSAEYPLSGGNDDYFLGASETIEMIGDGGPITIITVLDNGPPQGDTVSPASPVYVNQSGERTYELPENYPPIWPNPNPWLFPQNLIRPDGIRRREDVSRSRQAGKKNYKVSWSYSYHFTSPPYLSHPNA